MALWGLALDGAPMHGGLSLVVPVRHEGERVEDPLRCARVVAWLGWR